MSSEASPISAQLRRTYLANRRINCSEAIAFSGVALLVALGFDASGVAREIFVEGLRQGSDLEVMVDDAVILISMLLQHGYRVDELFAKLMRADTGTAADRFADEATGARKPSLLAAILGGAIKIELEEGDAMAAAYAARGNQS
jgi:hypothetical protein